MNELVKHFIGYGLPTFVLVIFLFLIIQDPTRAEKLQALVTKPFFKLFRWFSRTHISSEVSSTLNSFFQNKIQKYLLGDHNAKVKIKWVTESRDPAFSKEGNLILRLKEEKDQTKNILNAAKVAFPLVVCPLVRGNLHPSYGKAIDLTLMKKLSSSLGRHGKAVFKMHFLDPETEQDENLGALIQRFVELDRHGFFTTILLNELELVGEVLYADSNSNDYTREAINFIEYLLKLVNRQIGEEIELNYTEKPFSIGIMLLAKAHRVDTQGLRPYLKRLGIKIDKGIESIYVISFPNSYPFFDRLLKHLKEHENFNVEKVINTVDYSISDFDQRTNFQIAILSTNRSQSSDNFKERLDQLGVQIGKRFLGKVEDVSDKEALVNLCGLRAYIKYRNCSWHYPSSCKEFLKENEEYEFEVEIIDYETGTIFLSRKFLEEDPWNIFTPPNLGEQICVKVFSKLNNKLLCFYMEKFPVLLPLNELSWQQVTLYEDLLGIIGTEIKVQVIKLDKEKKEVIVSKKNLMLDPWPEIHANYPKGKELHGRVVEILDSKIKVDIGNSITAILPKESLDRTGHEYSNFQRNMVIGQGLDLYVSKVFLAKKYMRVDLTRNK